MPRVCLCWVAFDSGKSAAAVTGESLDLTAAGAGVVATSLGRSNDVAGLVAESLDMSTAGAG